MGWFSKSSDIPRKSRTALVEEIHAEFDSAQDRLLKRAYQLLSVETSPTELTGKKLLELGFINTPQAAAYTKKNAAIRLSKKTAELIQRYMINYPTLKFITEEELERICKKYSLIFAPVSAYIGEVPAKNVHEISCAPPLKMGDEAGDKCLFFYDEDFTDLVTEAQKKEIEAGIPCDLRYSTASSVSNNKILQEYFGLNHDFCRYNNIGRSFKTYNRDGLFIAAPVREFNLKGFTSFTDFGYATQSVIKVDDPVVFRYVKGGIQILSKWGPEAMDPSLAGNDN